MSANTVEVESMKLASALQEAAFTACELKDIKAVAALVALMEEVLSIPKKVTALLVK